MDTQKMIDLLTHMVTGLRHGAFAHYLQGKHFEGLGLKALGEKYAGHYAEEMEWLDKIVNRITDLGGELSTGPSEGIVLITDPVDYLAKDLADQEAGVEWLRKAVADSAADPVTQRLLLDYLVDEEEDLDWLRAQPELINLIGRENWYVRQL